MDALPMTLPEALADLVERVRGAGDRMVEEVERSYSDSSHPLVAPTMKARRIRQIAQGLIDACDEVELCIADAKAASRQRAA